MFCKEWISSENTKNIENDWIEFNYFWTEKFDKQISTTFPSAKLFLSFSQNELNYEIVFFNLIFKVRLSNFSNTNYFVQWT